jgi:hypothetical protein
VGLNYVLYLIWLIKQIEKAFVKLGTFFTRWPLEQQTEQLLSVEKY